MRIGIIILSVFIFSGCFQAQYRLPHPKVEGLTQAQQMTLIQSRARKINSLTALVEVSIDTPDLSGTLQIICVYERPGRLHLSASKGVFLSDRAIFELTFTRSHFRFDQFDEDGNLDRFNGRLEDFPKDHPTMAGLFWVRESIFLPGSMLGGKSPEGAHIKLSLDKNTLAVRRAILTPPDELETQYKITYDDYRKFGKAPEEIYVPFLVTVTEPSEGFEMIGRVLQLEYNQPIDEEAFGVLEDA